MTSQPLALFGSIGTWEAVLIGMVALLLFGNRLPEVMRSLGRGLVEFKKGLKDTQNEIERAASAEPKPPRSELAASQSRPESSDSTDDDSAPRSADTTGASSSL